jgi:methionyl-tRNA formyltransferase
VRIVFMGTPEIAVPSLTKLVHDGHEVVCVVTRPDRPQGRGRSIQPSPVKVAAKDLGLCLLQPARVNATEIVEEIRGVDPDLLVVVAFGSILRPPLLALARTAAINVHPSLLPALRGPAPLARAIWNGETWTGITVQYMSTELDAGDILLQRAFPILPEETTGELTARIADPAAALLSMSVRLLASGRAPRVEQDARHVSVAPVLTREEGVIRWSQDVFRIAARIRAVTPSPGARAVLTGKEVFIRKARPLDLVNGTTPGEIVDVTQREGIVVGTGRGHLSVLELQAAGRRVLPAQEFARGARVRTGDRFTEPFLPPAASAHGVVAPLGGVQ